MINILQFEEKCQGINYEYFGQEHSLVKMNNEMHRKIKAIMPARYRFIIQLSCIENDNQERILNTHQHFSDICNI